MTHPWLETAARQFDSSRWLHDPVGWSHAAIDWPKHGDLTHYQADILETLCRDKRTAMRGPHGTGKSTTAAIAVWWFATTRDLNSLEWKIITTASAWRHLQAFLWPEIHKWSRHIRWDALGRPPISTTSELLALNLKLNFGAATAVASSRAELIEGAHADHILYIVDEAKVVPNDTWDAIEGALSSGEAYVLALSTPGAPQGRFYDIHARKPGYEDWTARHVTLTEAIEAGRINPDWAAQRKLQWGQDSAIYANRVLGEFQASDEDATIPLAWIEAAVERWHEWKAAGGEPEGPRVLGVDVARSGADDTVFAHRNGMVITHLDRHRRGDTMVTTAKVQGHLSKGVHAMVDSLGIGAGVVDRLRELDEDVIAYTGSGKSFMRDRSNQYGMANIRSAAYWHLRELLDPAFEPQLCLPPDDLLLSDLSAPTWEIKTGVPPKIAVERKSDVVERLGRSPDAGDAVAMAMWFDKARPMISATHGSSVFSSTALNRRSSTGHDPFARTNDRARAREGNADPFRLARR